MRTKLRGKFEHESKGFDVSITTEETESRYIFKFSRDDTQEEICEVNLPLAYISPSDDSVKLEDCSSQQITEWIKLLSSPIYHPEVCITLLGQDAVFKHSNQMNFSNTGWRVVSTRDNNLFLTTIQQITNYLLGGNFSYTAFRQDNNIVSRKRICPVMFHDRMEYTIEDDVYCDYFREPVHEDDIVFYCVLGTAPHLLAPHNCQLEERTLRSFKYLTTKDGKYYLTGLWDDPQHLLLIGLKFLQENPEHLKDLPKVDHPHFKVNLIKYLEEMKAKGNSSL